MWHDQSHYDPSNPRGSRQLWLLETSTGGVETFSSRCDYSQTFMIIDEVLLYNGTLGRLWIGKINVITSATHQKICYQIPGEGVGHINSDQAMARKCSIQGLKKARKHNSPL
ncbi:hypothetical protein L3X38_003839 [Prunus dulcis]|uniref:Uncharacterized protein n=1 Tax=Prunus dulcis TaxID=3755 RepID=A0AAD4ZMS6_PRUDU|nr:hypothetical protein L3X38_003839 [Prunus dulcis]